MALGGGLPLPGFFLDPEKGLPEDAQPITVGNLLKAQFNVLDLGRALAPVPDIGRTHEKIHIDEASARFDLNQGGRSRTELLPGVLFLGRPIVPPVDGVRPGTCQ